MVFIFRNNIQFFKCIIFQRLNKITNRHILILHQIGRQQSCYRQKSFFIKNLFIINIEFTIFIKIKTHTHSFFLRTRQTIYIIATPKSIGNKAEAATIIIRKNNAQTNSIIISSLLYNVS